MNLYEIDAELYNLIDTETGEIADEQKFEELQLAREQKIEGVACWIKNLRSDIKELKEEENNLADRRRSKENLADRLENFIKYAIGEENFETAKVKISHRKSTAVNIMDETLIPAEFKIEKITVSIDKKAIGDALKFGEIVEGAELETRDNIQIK